MTKNQHRNVLFSFIEGRYDVLAYYELIIEQEVDYYLMWNTLFVEK